jgi:hypothetical protein
VKERERERKREGERERGREKKRERERGREKDREGGRKRERERCRICPEFLFLFLKGMRGSLAPFSYLVTLRSNYISLLQGHLVPQAAEPGPNYQPRPALAF